MRQNIEDMPARIQAIRKQDTFFNFVLYNPAPSCQQEKSPLQSWKQTHKDDKQGKNNLLSPWGLLLKNNLKQELADGAI